MRCENVLGQLSLFLDEVLEGDVATAVGQHLRGCLDCKREYVRLSKLRETLRNLPPIETPAYLHSLVDMKIHAAHKESLRSSLRSALEYKWSRIRTTEGSWYLTRLTGVMATFVFFIAIYSAMNPIDLGFVGQFSAQVRLSQAPRSQQLGINVLKNLGLRPLEEQKRPISSSDPKINDLSVVNFSQSTATTSQDDTVSVVAMVDRSGAAKLQDVLEYPADQSLLDAFADWIVSANWRPASRNGRAVDSPLVLTFSKVYVFD